MIKFKPQPIKIALIIGFAGYVFTQIVTIIKSINIMNIAIILTAIICVVAWSYLIYITRKNKQPQKREIIDTSAKVKYLQPHARLLQKQQIMMSEIMKLHPTQFEHFVASIYRELGYNAIVTKKSNDGGKDVVMNKDGKHYYVECKRYTDNISSPKMRDFAGACQMGGDHIKGIYVTTSDYTKRAKETAQMCNIKTINGQQLMDLIAQTKRTDLIEQTKIQN